MGSVDFDRAAGELYSEPPQRFVVRRNALAAEAISAGDAATAKALKKLRKPTIGAWLANLLVHERRAEIEELLTLGEMLRQAQRQLSGRELRSLVQQRHEVVATLVAEGRGLARSVRLPVNDAAAGELEQTLTAALADENAARELRAGRLTTALRHTGLGALEQLASSCPPGTSAHDGGRKAAPIASLGTPARPDDAPVGAAEHALKEAQALLSEARQVAERAAEQEAATTRLRDERNAAIDDLERQLEEEKHAAVSVGRELRQAQRAQQSAKRELEHAERQVGEAEAQLERLRREHDTYE